MAELEKIALNYSVRSAQSRPEPLPGAFFWLTAFYVVYCARPEDWVPGLNYLPLAKITGICVLIALFFSIGRAKRRIRDLPREGLYLIALVAFLLLTSVFSPVWKGGAFNHSLDFAKVAIAWILTFLITTNFSRLRRIMFIQTASVAAVALISVLKGGDTLRLKGVLRGVYQNSNDLAFVIVLAIPFCFAFLLRRRGVPHKIIWILAMFTMTCGVFLTASRAGFIELAITGIMCLWHFGVKGKRPQIILAFAIVGVILLFGVGRKLQQRFSAMSGEVNSKLDQTAYGSYQERRQLMLLSLETVARYPVFGIGVKNFTSYSGYWKEVHNCYLEIAAEGGIPALILYLLFFRRGFVNLKRLRRMDLDPETALFTRALHASLIGFVTGAFFAPEAYQFFPYFAVAQTTSLWALIQERVPARIVTGVNESYTGFDHRQSTSPHPAWQPQPEFTSSMFGLNLLL